MKKTVLSVCLVLTAVLMCPAATNDNAYLATLLQAKSEFEKIENIRDEYGNPLSDIYGLISYLVSKEIESRGTMVQERKEAISAIVKAITEKLGQKEKANPEFLLNSMLENRDNIIETIMDRTSLDGRDPGLIVPKALEAVGSSTYVHGYQVYTAATEWGNLACAAVVSAILCAAGEMDQLLLHVDRLHDHLMNDKGWRPAGSDDFQPGTVVFWGTSCREHTGIIVDKDAYGEWWTVDNSSGKRMVVKLPIHGYYGRVVYDAVNR
ncbi:MAG: hypothetical protein PHW04_18380 [Candidatus Wallbacteria bacterium]|nr:hypothetical protein [Candidatus Wallbacteria bacterium]